MGRPDLQLIQDVRQALERAADPTAAGAMRAYMRSEMPFHGVAKPQRSQILRTILRDHRFANRDSWEATVRTLWDNATHREERYCAIALTGTPSAREWQDPASIPLYDHLVTTGAWWDLVDEVAIHRIGPVLRAFPGDVTRTVYDLARDDRLWRRRAAIIAQVAAKQDTQTDLLAACIEPNLDDREFFIRKGIGWALRAYSKVDPDWVRWFVSLHEDRLSPLSKREALRHL